MIRKAFEPDPGWDYGRPVSFFLSRMPRKKLKFSFGHGDGGEAEDVVSVSF